MDLEQQLSQLHREGSLDSRGQFTIDTQRALRLLREKAAPNAHIYVLCLVQSAAASQARRLDVQVRPASLRLSFQGESPTTDELHQVLAMATGASGPPGLVHFARAVALGLGRGRSFEYLCSSGRLNIDGQRCQVSRGRTGPIRITVSWTQPSSASRWADLIQDRFAPRATRVEELRLLERFCPHFNGTLRVNGRVLTSRFGAPPEMVEGKPQPGFHYAQAALVCDDQPGCLRYEPNNVLRIRLGGFIFSHQWKRKVTDSNKKFKIEGDWKEPKVTQVSSLRSNLSDLAVLNSSCLAKIGLRLGLEDQGLCTLVKDGVMIEQFEHDFGVPGVEALLSCAGLRLDLSGFKAVRDRNFSRMLGIIQRAAENTLKELQEKRLLGPLLYDGYRLSDSRFVSAARSILEERVRVTLVG